MLIFAVSKFFPKFNEKYWEYRFLKNGLMPIKLRTNHSIIVHPNDNFISKSIFRYRFIYEDIYWILKSYSLYCNSFIDIGANIGYFTVTIGKSMCKKGIVIAIEPDPENFLILKKNVKNNSIIANLENVALSEKEGFMDLFINRENKGAHTLFEFHPSEYEGKIRIETTTLNKILEKYNPPEPILVKIDVEGFEFDVFKGGGKLLERKCIILSEFSPRLYRRLNREPKELLEEISRFGYKIFETVSGKRITPQGFDSLCKVNQTDLLFIKDNIL